MADRSWISTTTDYDKDGFIDTVAIEKEVVCTRNNPQSLLIEVVVTAKMKLIYIYLKT
jgi:hypothetical protein